MHRCQLFCHNQGIYLNEHMQVAKHWLFHDGGSGRIKTSPLICSANQWTGFCIIGTSVMEDSRCSSFTYTESLFLRVAKHNLLFLFQFFFSIWLFSHKHSLYILYIFISLVSFTSLYILSTTSTRFTDSRTLAGLLLQRAHLST